MMVRLQFSPESCSHKASRVNSMPNAIRVWCLVRYCVTQPSFLVFLLRRVEAIIRDFAVAAWGLRRRGAHCY